MLDELYVKDIALIEEATLAFAPGLTVLTGETGAGKTALLFALELITGCRADSHVVRDGASEASAQARLVDNGCERILKRRVSSQGRSRCTVDASMATVGELADAASSIRIHSQREQVTLLRSATQLSYLDARISRDENHLAPYRAAYASYLAALDAYRNLEEATQATAQELDRLVFMADQIDAVAPQEGEYEQLEEELPRLQHAEALALAVETALSCLHEDGGSLDTMAQAVNALGRQEGIDPQLDILSRRLDSLEVQVTDFARDLRTYREAISFDSERLEETLSRLEALSGLMKRFGPDMSRVFESREHARLVIEASQDSSELLDGAHGDLREAEALLKQTARELSRLRHGQADAFCAQLAESVGELAMQGVSFEFSFEALPFEQWNLSGSERIELLYRPAPTATAQPLARIASGGELSRILLALECMYHDVTGVDEDQTIVFDEIDQGVGGASGATVAKRLAELARHMQVIVVTHLPQVAAYADEQYVITKIAQEGQLPATSVVPVYGEDRVSEIARMLSGSVDPTALEHARVLLADAGGA